MQIKTTTVFYINIWLPIENSTPPKGVQRYYFFGKYKCFAKKKSQGKRAEEKVKRVKFLNQCIILVKSVRSFKMEDQLIFNN